MSFANRALKVIAAIAIIGIAVKWIWGRSQKPSPHERE